MMYLQSLTERLADGSARLPADLRARHVTYLQGAQNEDGGFSGRQGGSDLYYTGFALRTLSVLGELTPEVCARTSAYLRRCLTEQTSVVDFFSFLYSCLLVQLGGGPDVLADSPTDWPDRVASTLETFRTPDGGYAKAAGSHSGSTYHTFLVGLCYQLLGRAVPRSDELRVFIGSRRREDGGYVEIAPMRRSGTNPTAAAVGVLELLGEVPAAVSKEVAAFLQSMASPEGGLRANGRAPCADLLSTFTGAWTLERLGAGDRVDPVAIGRYVRSLEVSDGGFRGNIADDGRDVEYTFYGIGVLALLSCS